MAAIQFTIDQWAIWAPGLESVERAEVLPSLEFLPAMQRRRLSPLARRCFHVFWQVMPSAEPTGLIFCSRHGETQRSVDLISPIIEEQPLSPASFSLSVHNATAGLLSIARTDVSEHVAIAQSGNEGLAVAFLEAAMMLESGSLNQVVVVLCDDPLPILFQAFEPNETDIPWAIAFRIYRSKTPEWTLQRIPLSSEAPLATAVEKRLPPPLEFAEALSKNSTEFTLKGLNCDWQWSRRHA